MPRQQPIAVIHLQIDMTLKSRRIVFDDFQHQQGLHRENDSATLLHK